MNKIKVVIVKPGEEPYVEEIENTLETMQEIVGGYIEVTNDKFLEGCLIVCNEEGKLRELEFNRVIHPVGGYPDVIRGTFFVCAAEGEEFTGLIDGDAWDVVEWFS